MKRTLKVIITVCIIILLSMEAYAADALYRMLHADEVESFKVDQTAFIVGQILDKPEDKYTVKVIKVISGTLKEERILVPDGFKYGYGLRPELLPAVNDYCILSLKRKGSVYKIAWGAFKADSGDYKTLNIITDESHASPGLMADMACIEWYVNTEGKENDFSFMGDRKGGAAAYVKRVNRERLQIYPKENAESSDEGTDTGIQEQETLAPKEKADGTDTSFTEDTAGSNNSFSLSIIIICIVCLCAGAAGALLFKHRKS